MSEAMTTRERWVAALDMQPVDRIPFWPKLDGSFARNQAAPYASMSVGEVHRSLGADPTNGMWPCIRETHPHCRVETTQADGLQRTTIETPAGTLRSSSRFDPVSSAPYPIEHPVKNLDDIRAMKAFHEDAQLEVNEEGLRNAREQVKDAADACTHVGIGTSPLMQWLQYAAGVEKGQIFLMEHPGAVSELFHAEHRVVLRKMELLGECMPADFALLVENTSTTLFSPEQYRQWNYPHVLEYARVMKDAGKRLVLHMCGHLKAILPELETLPVCGFEAFTSPTVGNTTLVDGRGQCPTKCLVGGTNAALWTRSADEIIGELDAHLSALPHHRGLVISSGGVMPPMCRYETVKRVTDWLKAFPVKC